MATPAGIFAGMASNTLLLDVLAGRPVPRAPVWLMRQAGRILPEYRALRASLSGFKELVETPALAAEATLQPIDHLGVDAAIVFSDILTVPEALGLPYEMIPGTGPRFPKTIGTVADIDALRSPEDAAADLAYVYGAVAESRRRAGASANAGSAAQATTTSSPSTARRRPDGYRASAGHGAGTRGASRPFQCRMSSAHSIRTSTSARR